MLDPAENYRKKLFAECPPTLSEAITATTHKTLIRHPYNAQLYFSPYAWVHAPSALRQPFNSPAFYPVPQEMNLTMFEIFGDLPEYPDEYIEISALKNADLQPHKKRN